MHLEFAKGVLLEFDEACAHYDAADPRIGAIFREETRKAIETILHHPFRARKITPRVRRLLYTRRFPFAILYQTLEDEVLILSIMHLSRRPGYWRPRARKK